MSSGKEGVIINCDLANLVDFFIYVVGVPTFDVPYKSSTGQRNHLTNISPGYYSLR